MGLLQLLLHSNQDANESLPLVYENIYGMTCKAPMVEISVTRLLDGKASSRCMARIDTGADVTCIPRRLFLDIRPLPMGRSFLIRGHGGKVGREWTKYGVINLWNGRHIYKSVRPARGFLVQDDECPALLGMDVLSHFRLEGEGSDWKLLPRRK